MTRTGWMQCRRGGERRAWTQSQRTTSTQEQTVRSNFSTLRGGDWGRGCISVTDMIGFKKSANVYFFGGITYAALVAKIPPLPLYF